MTDNEAGGWKISQVTAPHIWPAPGLGFVSEVLRCNSSRVGRGDDKHDPALGNVPLTGGWRRSGGGHLEGEGRR